MERCGRSLNSLEAPKLKVELKTMRDERSEFQSPARPGKEAGTEADVQTHAPGLPSGTKIKAWAF